MKLSDVFNSFSRKFSEVSNFVRYPIENISRITQRRAQNIYENIEFPVNGQQENSSESNQFTTPFPEKIDKTEEYNGYISNENGNSKHHPEYFTDLNGIVTQTLPKQLIKQQTNISLLPPLKPNTEIRGRRGRYQVEDIIKKSERIYLYKGIHVVSNKKVWIKEYLLPESDFNQQETKEQKDKFEELASINFKSEEGKDFRLITPLDAIAARNEGRCYLITEFIDNRITLREYLDKTQLPMTSQQVRKVMELVLVSLKYLHSDSKINLPTSQRPHGNLSLDSLLISQETLNDNTESEQFFIYLSNFALWENLFKLPNLKLNHPSIEKDLQDLGTTAFYLLRGTDKDSDFGYYLDPKNEKHWVNINDISLEHFIRRLLGLDTPFTSAEEARNFLLSPQYHLPNTIEEVIEAEDDESELSSDSKKLPILLIVIISGLLLGFVGVVSWSLFSWIIKGKPPEMPTVQKSICCIKKVEGTGALKQKLINYNVPTSETTLKYLMTTQNIVSAEKTFPEELKNRVQKSLLFKINYKPVKTIPEAIAKVINNDTKFFITQHSDEELKNIPNANKLITEKVAYEGIVVFVPFSDSQRENSLPEALNGKISFEDLRKIFRGEIKNWKELNSKLPDLPIKVYIPNDESLTTRFKEILYKKDSDKSKLDFNNLIRENNQFVLKTTQETLNQILGDFESENQIGGISFGLLSKVYNQCAAYPLSIGEKGQEVQVLVQKNDKDITPKTDLCNDKGGYHPNPEVIKEKYSLKYPISVVYSKDGEKSLAGKKIVEILKTDEGQTLLKEAGLVPIRKIDNY